MPDRADNPRRHRSPPLIRRPRVPPGQRLVREQGWLTTDHPNAAWFRLAGHSPDWAEVRIEQVAAPGGAARTVVVHVQPSGRIALHAPAESLGAEAIRIIATVIRAGQRAGAG